MKDKEICEIISRVSGNDEIKSDDIPSIDLYIDQILNLVNGKMGQSALARGERLLTKTMINNYSKDGIIKPIEGKKYSKEHIIQMLLVYSMKSTVSMTEIKRFLYGLYEDKSFDGDKLIACYDRYIETKQKSEDKLPLLLDNMLEGFDTENEDDFTVALLSMIALSAQLKYIAQGLIDSHYPPCPEPENPKKIIKEIKKEAKKEIKKVKKKKDEDK